MDIWTGSEELNRDPEFLKSQQAQEFFELPIIDALSDEGKVEEVTKGSSRRDFLKYMGFGLGAATIAAGCDIPVKKGIPYIVKPDAIVPGVATYYASTFVKGGDVCPVVVKTREGRPIKIEGNAMSAMTDGGTSARVQASVLELYDTSRLKHPGQVKESYDRRDPITQMSWAEIDEVIKNGLKPDGRIRIVTNSIVSPSTKQILEDFKAKYPNTQVITYDPVSSSAMLMANVASFGEDYQLVPDYHFDKAKVIVSLGADFLGTWISPVEYATKFTKNRRIKDTKNPEMSRLIYMESSMSLTGSNADNRILIRPSEYGLATATLYNEVAKLASAQTVSAGSGSFKNEKAAASIAAAAKDLWDSREEGSMVVSGSNNLGEQILVNAINNLIGAYGKTMDFNSASYQRQGIDSDVQNLITEMENNGVDAVFVMGDANPVYDLPNGDQFGAALKNVALSVSLSTLPNETFAACKYSCPDHHYLESWGDVEPKNGHFLLIQPTIQPLFNTRQAQNSLLSWADAEGVADSENAYLDYLKAYWNENVFLLQTDYARFQSFWDNSLHDGVFNADIEAGENPGFAGDVNFASTKISQPSSSDMEISFFEPIGVGVGQFANNPWLQEMPDPLTRCVWDNLLLINVQFDGNRRFVGFNGLENGDYSDVTIGESSVKMPAYQLYGQMEGTCAIALGYGRTVSGRAGTGVGKSMWPFLSIDADGNTQYYATNVTVSGKNGRDLQHACVQYHHTYGVQQDGGEENVDETALMSLGKGYQGSLTDRSVLYYSNLDELSKTIEKVKKKRETAEYLNKKTLYPYEEYKKKFYNEGHHWGMSIDLSLCIGCGACQVACVAENNVPIVGKQEVFRHHEMTWLRIDRYFYGDADNPNVVYQPMMCQHCDNAPCENVCPVGATNHSSEGLNQMTYNRCIGTRYCANNCPYKVRRFNWYDYTTADLFPWNEKNPLAVESDVDEYPFYGDPLTRMVLNPDVTVRSRGVIEKCSFCVQRIQEGKLTAKVEGRTLRDSDITPACVSACPTGGISFGDTNNKDSQVSKELASDLSYYALEEVNTRSSVGYQFKVTNKNNAIS